MFKRGREVVNPSISVLSARSSSHNNNSLWWFMHNIGPLSHWSTIPSHYNGKPRISPHSMNWVQVWSTQQSYPNHNITPEKYDCWAQLNSQCVHWWSLVLCFNLGTVFLGIAIIGFPLYKMAVKPSYIYNMNSYTDKVALPYWNGSNVIESEDEVYTKTGRWSNFIESEDEVYAKTGR